MYNLNIYVYIYIFVVGKEQDSDDEQIDNGITLKSKSIMQKTLYFLKKMKCVMINNYYNGLRIYNEGILTIYLLICGLTVGES